MIREKSFIVLRRRVRKPSKMFTTLLLSMSLAATPGIPDVPLSIDNNVWIGIQNDYLTVTPTDYGRSFGFKFGIDYDNWLLNYDYSGITKEYGSSGEGLRIDVNTILLGYQIPLIENHLSRLTITPAFGYVKTGNYGGESGQNEFHRLLDEDTKYFAYEDTPDFLFGSFLLSYETRRRWVVQRISFGYELSAEERNWYFEYLLGIDTEWFGLYAGIRHEDHNGAETVLGKFVEKLEDGTRLVIGLNATEYIHYRMIYDMNNQYGSGEILFSF